MQIGEFQNIEHLLCWDRTWGILHYHISLVLGYLVKLSVHLFCSKDWTLMMKTISRRISSSRGWWRNWARCDGILGERRCCDIPMHGLQGYLCLSLHHSLWWFQRTAREDEENCWWVGVVRAQFWLNGLNLHMLDHVVTSQVILS